MALRITCPGCKTALKLDDDQRGRKVECDHCGKFLKIPEAPSKKEKANPDVGVQEGRKLKTKPAAVAEQEGEEEQEQEEERPIKKKKKKKKSSSKGLLIAGGAGILVVLILAVGASAYYFTRSDLVKQAVAKVEKEAQNPAQQQQDIPPPPRGGVPIVPGIKEGNPDAKKGGSSIVNSVRGAGYRTERRNELRQIGLFYQQFCDGTPKSARTKENFLEFIKRDSKVLHENISEGYYVMNMRSDIASSTSVIAYERDLDRTGHLAVRGDLSVDYVPLPELKQLVGK